jgi:hypothetical protein
MVSSTGIFVNVEDHLKVLIPRSSLDGFGITTDTCKDGPPALTYTKDEIVYKLGSDIDVVIAKMQYEGGKYSCIGRLSEDSEVEDGESEEDDSVKEEEPEEEFGENVVEESDANSDTDEEEESGDDEEIDDDYAEEEYDDVDDE